MLWMFRILAVFLLASSCLCSPFVSSSKKPRKPVQLNDVLMQRFAATPFNGTWISDNEIAYLKTASLTKINVETGERKRLIPILTMMLYEDYTFSPDNKKVLFKSDTHSVFRYSVVARYTIYDIASGDTQKVANGSLLRYCAWSPVGNAVVYVLKNNVFHRDPSGKEVQLSTDGEQGVIYNGVPDWVYEEEVLYSGNAIWFAPDGKKLVYIHFNDTEVFGYPLLQYGDSTMDFPQYPHEELIKYPKAGTPNPSVQLRLVDLEKPDKGYTVIEAPKEIVSKDHVILSVGWSSPESFLTLWANRRQNLGTLQKCQSAGACDEVIRIAEPHGWLTFGPFICAKKSQHCLMRNWMGDLMQIWNVDLEAKVNIWKPFGNFTVTKIFGYREETDDVFFEAAPRDLPMELHIYKNDKCLSCDIKYDDGTPCTYASASFSKNFSYYVLSCDGPNIGYIKVLKTDTNQEVLSWETNDETREDYEEYEHVKVQYVDVDVEGGYKAIVKLMMPSEVDFNDPSPPQKYPMIVSVYGGPNSVRVKDHFIVDWDSYLVTSRKVIYAIIDGRGSGNKGKSMLFEINNRLGSVEVDDQLTVTKHLQNKLPFIDASRTAIWGWSYGGFVSAWALAKDSENIFKCGISVAPVTNWVYYDSIYTERFMGLPIPKDNLVNYDAGDVSKHVDNFKKHDFLLIHGSGDDNVHFQQSMILSRALQLADINFEQMFYPDEAHSLVHVRRHLYHTMGNFWDRCLNLETPEEKSSMQIFQ